MTTTPTGSPDEPCQNWVLDEDGERVCRCGDEGLACESCSEAEAAYWGARWAVASPEERDPERYRQDMIDAGRSHLLHPED